jgi:hypothetical protein
MKICPICEERQVGTKKSHIIPKMFRNKLGGKKSKIKIKKIQPSKKSQDQDKRTIRDIPKEKGLLCDECEHNLSILEGYFSKNIYSTIQSNNYTSEYRSKVSLNKRSKEIDNINMKLVSLFYQSILLRQHLTNLEEYKGCKIDNELAEKIRSQLNSILADKPSKMMENLEIYSDLYYMPFKNWTVSKNDQKDNFLGGIPNQSKKFLLLLNDLRVIILEDFECITDKKTKYYTFKIDVKSDKMWLKESKKIVMEIDIYLGKVR